MAVNARDTSTSRTMLFFTGGSYRMTGRSPPRPARAAAYDLDLLASLCRAQQTSQRAFFGCPVVGVDAYVRADLFHDRGASASTRVDPASLKGDHLPRVFRIPLPRVT